MKKSANFLKVFFCLFYVTLGCAKLEDEITKEIEPESQLVSVESLSENITITAQPTSKPEKYMVFISWPKINPSKKIRIRMDKILNVVDPSQTTFSHEVNHNQILTYNFEILDENNKIEKSFSKQIVVPTDFVVGKNDNQVHQNRKINVNRFFISEVFQTNGYNVEITANELISDNGLIETFPDGAKANLNQAGRHGGEIKLNIGSASGTLKITMRGEHGGDGSKGISFLSRAQSGTDAEAGKYVCECNGGKNCPFSQPKPQLSIYAEPDSTSCFCDSYGSNATAGASGTKGNQGLPAQSGGDSGSLIINIKQGPAFYIETLKLNGIAGIPGEGGDGMLGGIGGAGRTSDKDCRGLAGANGLDGASGDPGSLGTDGVLGSICIYIQSEGRNECF